MSNNELFRKALDAAGYNHEPATEEAVRSCFADYVVAGYWSNLSYEDIEDDGITVTSMCYSLIRG